MDWLEYVFLKFQLAIAGFFGALVAARYQKDTKTRKDVVIFVLSGCAIAHFLTGWVAVTVLKMSDDTVGHSLGAIGFLLGMFGGALITAIMRGLEAADLWSLVKSRFGGGSQ